MSTSTTVSTPTASLPKQAVEEVASQEAKRKLAVTKIMGATGCSSDDAEGCLDFIAHMANQARLGVRASRGQTGVYHLDDRDMSSGNYPLMDAIMVHGATAEPNTAHAAVQDFVLHPNESALVHDNPTGQPEDCVVTLSIGPAV